MNRSLIIILIIFFSINIYGTQKLKTIDYSKLKCKYKKGLLCYKNGDKKPFTGKVIKTVNKKKKSETNYKNGKKDGKEIRWNNKGKKSVERYFKNGKKDGKEIKWYIYGQKRLELSFKNGKKDGKSTGWYINKKKKYEGTFKDGQPYGKWIYWDKYGEKISEINHKKKKREDEQVILWHKNGIKKSETNYKNGKKDGKWIYWNIDGKKISEKNYKNGKKDGKFIKWYPNGQKKEELSFKNGKKDEEDKYWDENLKRLRADDLRRLDKNQVLNIIKRTYPKVRVCAENFNISGRIPVKFKINPNGKVSDIEISSNAEDAQECIYSQIKEMHFPRFSGKAISMTFPFKL